MNILKQFARFLDPRYQNLFMEYKVNFKPRYSAEKPHPELKKIVDSKIETYQEILNEAMKYKELICEIEDAGVETDTLKPVWNNGFLPGLDIIGIYTMVSKFKPNKYLEIGSGNSTKVAYKAKQEQKLNFEIISIDPMPRAEIDSLADKVIRQPVENISFDFGEALQENDILFIDNSHRVLPNSDAMVFFMEILPKLKKGVIVHVHDIYIPFDYPQYMCDRFYSEQYALAAFLLANPEKYEPLLPNYYIHRHKELSKIVAPFWEHPNLKGVEQHGGSFWFRVN